MGDLASVLPAMLAAIGAIVGPIFAYLIKDNTSLRAQVQELQRQARDEDDAEIADLKRRLEAREEQIEQLRRRQPRNS